MKIKVIIYLLLLTTGWATAQEPEKKRASEPFDLPNAIIYGDATLNVSGGVKQTPSRFLALSKRELDSINSLEKQQSILIPQQQINTNLYQSNQQSGFLDASFGRFSTAKATAGYAFNMSDYKLFAKADLDLSSGFITNTEYSKFGANVFSDYITPEKFWLFGGSKTRTKLDFNMNSYKNYSSTMPNDLSSNNIDFAIDVDGLYNGFKFKTGIDFNNTGFTGYGRDNSAMRIGGYASLLNPLTDFTIGGTLRLEMNSFNSSSANVMLLNGTLDYEKNDTKLYGLLGVKMIGSTLGETNVAPDLMLGIDYKASYKYTLRAKVESGLHQNYFQNLLGANPYLNRLNLVPSHDLAKLNVSAIYHSSKDFFLVAGGKLNLSKNLPIYVADTLNSFGINYLDGMSFGVYAEAQWQLEPSSNLIFAAEFNSGSLDSTKKAMPYLIPLKASVNYEKTFFEQLQLKLGLEYVGQRNADLAEIKKLPAFINLNFGISYLISNRLSVNASFENILNQDIYVWDNLRERTLFARLGVFWSF